MCPTDTTVYALPFAATKKDEEAWLAEAFIILDTDGDGTIGGSDLNAFFSGHLRKALTHEEIASMIGAADVNGDGGVDLHEFQLLASVSLSSLRSPTFLSKQRQEVERTVLRSIFDVLDVNKDGLLSAVDLNKFMTMIGSPLSDQDVHSMFDMAGLHQVPTVAIDFNAFLKLVNPLV
ncbi:hypothetical protein KP509_24G033400 [Ceratopteris richardii]|nr:hypothetical protein KP509_24G033400 [Ceratopteris richardii]